jgi:hypothetical protein
VSKAYESRLCVRLRPISSGIVRISRSGRLSHPPSSGLVRPGSIDEMIDTGAGLVGSSCFFDDIGAGRMNELGEGSGCCRLHPWHDVLVDAHGEGRIGVPQSF